MVAPTKRLDFGGISEGASAAALFDATGGTVSLLAKAVAALRGSKGLEVTGAGVSDFGSLTCASTSSESVQFGLVHSGTAPTAALDFMVLRNASAAGLTARITTAGLLVIADASGTLFTLNGGVALPAGNYWVSMAATKGTTTGNGFAAYWLHNADTNVQLETNSSSTANTGTAVYTVVRYGKNSSGGTYTVQGDKPASADGSTSLIDLPPVFGTPSDNLGLTDSVAAAKVTQASVTDALGLTDTAAPVQTMVRSTTDALGIADSDFVETFVIDDSAADSEGLSDSISPALAMDRSGADTLGLSDTTAAVIDRQVGSTDALGLTDATTATLTLAAVDACGLADSTAVALSVVVVDAIGLDDSTSGSQTSAGALTATDVETLEDVLTVDRTATLSDASGLSDATVRALAVSAAATDTAGLSDATSGNLTLGAAAGDDAGLTDAVSFTLVEATADTLGLSDAVTFTFDRAATSADSIGLTDSVAGARCRYLTDAMGTTDAVALSAIFQQIITDTLGLTDAITPDGRSVAHPGLALTSPRSQLELVGTRSNLDLMG